MKTIYLGGHGEWNMSDGYVELPKGCSISFYTEFSKNMFTSDMKDIIKGKFKGSVKSKIEQYKTCNNYTLHPDPANCTECRQILSDRNDSNLALVMFAGGRAWTLKEIFAWATEERLAVDFIWCACRFTGLKDAGGKAVGVNAAQGTWGDRDNQGKLVAPGGGQDPDLFYFNPTTKIVKNL